MNMKYDKDKMKQLVKNDTYLRFMYKDLTSRGNDEDTTLRVLYNENVDDDGAGDYRHVYSKLK